MAEEIKAKKVFTLEEIRFNEENKVMAIFACIPLIGLILLFVEKNDNFVRYMGAQFAIIFLSGFVLPLLAVIPVLGWLIIALYGPTILLVVIIAMLKVSKGERFDIPMVSGWALKLMGAF